MYNSSNKAVKDFTTSDTQISKIEKSEREKYIKADWDRLLASIDSDWTKYR